MNRFGGDGFSQFFVLFDHAREELKDVVCGNLAGAPRPNPVPEEAAWEDTSDRMNRFSFLKKKSALAQWIELRN